MFLHMLKPKFSKSRQEKPSAETQGRSIYVVSDSSSADESSVFDSVSRSPGTPLTLLETCSLSFEKVPSQDTEPIVTVSPKELVSSCYRTPPLPKEGLERDAVDTSVEVSIADFSSRRDSGLFRRASSRLSRNSLVRTHERVLTNLEPAAQICASPTTPSKHRKSVCSTPLDSSDDIEIPKRNPLRPTPSQKRYSTGALYRNSAFSPTPVPFIPAAVPRTPSLVSSSKLPTISTFDTDYRASLQGLDSALLKSRVRAPSRNLTISGEKGTLTGRRVSSSVPKLNESENLLKVKIFIGEMDREVVALKLKKDKLSNLNELIDVITYKAMSKDSSLSSEEVNVDMVFANPLLKPVSMKGSANGAFGSSNNEFLMDYVLAKEKVYVRAYA